MDNRRSIKNLILVPRLQLPFAFFSTLTAFLFASISVAIFYLYSNDALNLILELTDAGEESMALIKGLVTKSLYTILILAVVFIAANVFISAMLSHKMVGPVVQFIRHTKALQNKDYSSRIHLRPGDGFYELANELNKLAEKLEKKV